MKNEIIDCDGIYEVHPGATGSWCVVNSQSGDLRCTFSAQSDAVREAKRLNAERAAEAIES